MQKARRARAAAIAKAEDAGKVMRLSLLVICVGAVSALLALPAVF